MDVNQLHLPLLVDTEALRVGEYVVLDLDFRVVRVFESLDEAEAFVAASNGSDKETVRQDSEARGQTLHQYRDNLRRNRHGKSEDGKS